MAEEQSLGRIPVRPYSYSTENAQEAMVKELLVDYENGVIYIKTSDGRIINTSASEQTINAIINYITSNPEIITNMDLIELDDSTMSIAEAIAAINTKAVNAQNTASNHNHDSDYLKKSNDTTTGPITFNGKILLSNNPDIIGDVEPENPDEFQLFFKFLDESPNNA